VLELGQAYARAGAPEAIEPLSEVVELGEDPASIAEAAIELSGMYFYGGRAAEGAAILRRAQARLPASGPARERLKVALLGLSYSSVSARCEADAEIANLRDPGGPARGSLQATTLATLALDEVMYLRSASTAIDFAQRALAEGLPLEPHRGENWTLAALFALMFSDHLDAAGSEADEILARAREPGAAVTVVAISTFRAYVGLRRGDLAGAQADAQTAIDLAPDLLGAEFLVPAVSTAVLAGLERDETPDALRGLIGRTGVRFDPEFTPSAQLLYASGVLRAAAGNHHAAVEELHGWALDHLS
jgi:tetratricopeptide (TPR) repeat protein